MARKIRDATLETKAARKRLPAGPEPHWRSLDQGLHLGYRRRVEGGSWTARRRSPLGSYQETKLGAADDIQDENGVTFFDYWQAQEKARTWDKEEGRRDKGLDPKTGLPPCEVQSDYTVADAMRDYLNNYADEGKALSSTKTAVDAHILPIFKGTLVSKLTSLEIKNWHRHLANSPARVRSKKGMEAQYRKAPTTANAKRGRKATANRLLTILKAALNYAWREGKAVTDLEWRRVKPYKKVSAAKISYLNEDECLRLVNGCDPKKHPGFRELVKAALLTGCRYGELSALEASDYDAAACTLDIRTSKSGEQRYVTLTDEAKRFFDGITAGLSRNQRLFRRENNAAWGKAHQHRPIIAACKAANISPAITFHILRHTHGSLLAMKGVPMAVIAKQLGHVDSRMTEKHYAHLSKSYAADTIRDNFPDLGISPKTNVTRIGTKHKG